MTPNRPYLLRAFNEWILDNGMTPHVLVDAEAEGVRVPGQYIEDGRIVLNVSPAAVRDLVIENEYLSFNARFSGKACQVYAPMGSVLAIYARESGKGMVFPDEGSDEQEPDEPVPPVHGRKSHLKVVK